jgi:hypothetical protein
VAAADHVEHIRTGAGRHVAHELPLLGTAVVVFPAGLGHPHSNALDELAEPLDEPPEPLGELPELPELLAELPELPELLVELPELPVELPELLGALPELPELPPEPPSSAGFEIESPEPHALASANKATNVVAAMRCEIIRSSLNFWPTIRAWARAPCPA